MKYKCERTFKAENKKEFNYGDIINELEYHALTYSDKSYFSKQEDNLPTIGDMFNTDIPGGMDLDFTTPF